MNYTTDVIPRILNNIASKDLTIEDLTYLHTLGYIFKCRHGRVYNVQQTHLIKKGVLR